VAVVAVLGTSPLTRSLGALAHWGRRAEPPKAYELKLTFREPALVYKSLQAARTLGALPPQDELLDDTIDMVDRELSESGRVGAGWRP
jgi:hypothetical protein